MIRAELTADDRERERESLYRCSCRKINRTLDSLVEIKIIQYQNKLILMLLYFGIVVESRFHYSDVLSEKILEIFIALLKIDGLNICIIIVRVNCFLGENKIFLEFIEPRNVSCSIIRSLNFCKC